MRQDPDIIYCAEVRDEDTARLLIETALTGHLAITSLHTGNAVEALFRLIDCGIEPFLVSSATLGVLAQRLVRKACKFCKEEYSPSDDIVELLKKENLYSEEKEITLVRAKGCKNCLNTGYKGRVPVYELLIMDEEIKNLLSSGADYTRITELVREKNIRTIKYDGLKKAIEGITTIEEVFRLCAEQKDF